MKRSDARAKPRRRNDLNMQTQCSFGQFPGRQLNN